jgi:hypothetical protein
MEGEGFEEKRHAFNVFLYGNLKKRDHLEILSIDRG